MTVLLVRHVEAGDRGAWAGDDRSRPVDGVGAAQARGLVRVLADRPIERILSSPYLRCVQSVQPLAAARGLEVEEEEALAEGAPPDLVDRLLRRVAGRDVVLCTHGDVMGQVVSGLERRGLLAAPARWPKGATWVVPDATLTTGPPGEAAAVASYLPPP